MPAPYSRSPQKLRDCEGNADGIDKELFLVEGDSASASVTRVRNRQQQAVLPMQGKPLNTAKASVSRIRANPWFCALASALGVAPARPAAPEQLRYRRIMLLFDPDADGIHCGALMLMYFQRFMPAAFASGHIWMVRPPLLRITAPALSAPLYARSQAHYEHMMARLQAEGVRELQTLRYRGLGSLEESLLIDTCVAPATRQADQMSLSDAQMAARYFGGAPPLSAP